jgi:hypothetical protein
MFSYYLKANPTSLFYHPEPRRLFTGLENGNILVFYFPYYSKNKARL